MSHGSSLALRDSTLEWKRKGLRVDNMAELKLCCPQCRRYGSTFTVRYCIDFVRPKT